MTKPRAEDEATGLKPGDEVLKRDIADIGEWLDSLPGSEDAVLEERRRTVALIRERLDSRQVYDDFDDGASSEDRELIEEIERGDHLLEQDKGR